MAKEFVGLRLPPELIASVDVLAKEETRTRANAIERILTQWFLANRPDLLAPPNPEEVNAEFRKALGIDGKR